MGGWVNECMGGGGERQAMDRQLDGEPGLASSSPRAALISENFPATF